MSVRDGVRKLKRFFQPLVDAQARAESDPMRGKAGPPAPDPMRGRAGPPAPDPMKGRAGPPVPATYTPPARTWRDSSPPADPMQGSAGPPRTSSAPAYDSTRETQSEALARRIQENRRAEKRQAEKRRREEAERKRSKAEKVLDLLGGGAKAVGKGALDVGGAGGREIRDIASAAPGVAVVIAKEIVRNQDPFERQRAAARSASEIGRAVKELPEAMMENLVPTRLGRSGETRMMRVSQRLARAVSPVGYRILAEDPALRAVKTAAEGRPREAVRRLADDFSKAPISTTASVAGAGAIAGRGASVARHGSVAGHRAAQVRPAKAVRNAAQRRPTRRMTRREARRTNEAERQRARDGETQGGFAGTRQAAPSRQQRYSPNVAVRAVQKRREDTRRAKGKDPYELRGRAAGRAVKKQAASLVAAEHAAGLGREQAAGVALREPVRVPRRARANTGRHRRLREAALELIYAGEVRPHRMRADLVEAIGARRRRGTAGAQLAADDLQALLDDLEANGSKAILRDPRLHEGVETIKGIADEHDRRLVAADSVPDDIARLRVSLQGPISRGRAAYVKRGGVTPTRTLQRIRGGQEPRAPRRDAPAQDHADYHREMAQRIGARLERARGGAEVGRLRAEATAQLSEMRRWERLAADVDPDLRRRATGELRAERLKRANLERELTRTSKADGQKVDAIERALAIVKEKEGAAAERLVEAGGDPATVRAAAQVVGVGRPSGVERAARREAVSADAPQGRRPRQQKRELEARVRAASPRAAEARGASERRVRAARAAEPATSPYERPSRPEPEGSSTPQVRESATARRAAQAQRARDRRAIREHNAELRARRATPTARASQTPEEWVRTASEDQLRRVVARSRNERAVAAAVDEQLMRGRTAVDRLAAEHPAARTVRRPVAMLERVAGGTATQRAGRARRARQRAAEAARVQRPIDARNAKLDARDRRAAWAAYRTANPAVANEITLGGELVDEAGFYTALGRYTMPEKYWGSYMRPVDMPVRGERGLKMPYERREATMEWLLERRPGAALERSLLANEQELTHLHIATAIEARYAHKVNGRSELEPGQAAAEVAALNQRGELQYTTMPAFSRRGRAARREVVVPRVVERLLHHQYKARGLFGTSADWATRRFVMAVLPFSVLWHTGNAADLSMRLALSGVRPGDSVLASELAQQMRALDPAFADRVTRPLVGHFGARRAQTGATVEQIGRALPRLRGATAPLRAAAERATAGARRATGATSARSLRGLVGQAPGRAYVRGREAMFDAATAVENRGVNAAQGKVLRQMAGEMGVNVADHVALGRRMAARFRSEPGLVDEFHRRTLEIVGDYVVKLPLERRVATPIAPFVRWMRESIRFTLVTLPKNHPIKVALYVQAAAMTEEQRRQLGLSNYITRAEARRLNLPLPGEDFNLGAVPVLGTRWATAFYTSFGETGRMLEDPLMWAAGYVNPAGLGTAAAGAANYRRNLLEAAIKWQRGGREQDRRLPRGAQLPYTVQRGLLDTFIPGMKQARTVLEGSGRPNFDSTVWSPQVVRGTRRSGIGIFDNAVLPIREATEFPSQVSTGRRGRRSWADEWDVDDAIEGARGTPDLLDALKANLTRQPEAATAPTARETRAARARRARASARAARERKAARARRAWASAPPIDLRGASPHLQGYAQDAARFGLTVSSGARNWGTGSHHEESNGANALDFAGTADQMLAFATYAGEHYPDELDELIYTPLGYGIKNGARTAPYAEADHFDHVHLARLPGRGRGEAPPYPRYGAPAGMKGAVAAEPPPTRVRRIGPSRGAVSRTGLDLVAEFEGFYAEPYADPVGYATVGYGELLGYRGVNGADRSGVWIRGQRTPGRLTEPEARKLLEQRLNNDYGSHVSRVAREAGVRLNQNQYDALTSFVFNLGPGVLERGRTVGDRLRAGDLDGVADALLLYDNAGGQKLAGLTRRRKAERDLMLRPGSGPANLFDGTTPSTGAAPSTGATPVGAGGAGKGTSVFAGSTPNAPAPRRQLGTDEGLLDTYLGQQEALTEMLLDDAGRRSRESGIAGLAPAARLTLIQYLLSGRARGLGLASLMRELEAA